MFSEALETQLTLLRLLERGAADVWWQEVTVEIRAGQMDAVGMTLKYGAPYYWSPELGRLAATAAQQFPQTWTLEKDVLLTPFGFMWFAELLVLPRYSAPEAYQTDIRAVSWCPMYNDGEQSGAVFCVWTEDPTIKAPPGLPSMQPHTMWHWEYGHSVKDALNLLATYADYAHYTKYREDKRARQEVKVSVVGACLALLQQEVLCYERQTADRHTRRRLAHSGWSDPPLVNVVRLRRRATGQGTSEVSDVEWTCQWLVRGHWRQQWHPSVKHHEVRWISPHVKGPPDKPLKQTSVPLFAVVR